MTSKQDSLENRECLANRGKNRGFFVLTASMVLGGIFMHLAIPWMFRWLPNEMTRTATILTALDRPDVPPACIFGNSVVMNGVDSRRLSEQLGLPASAWNLASPGQELYESFLLYQEVPINVRLVVLGVFADSLEQEPCLPPSKYDAFFMYGYRPTLETQQATARYATRET